MSKNATAEIVLTPEGISMSLYDGDELNDEAWETWAELSPDHEIPPVDEEVRFSLAPEERADR